MPGLYCSSLTQYVRYNTREVAVGDVPLGGKNPIRIQSMTTTDTMNTIATVEQTIRMVNSGCEYVRITAPSINDAQNLAEIKKELRRRGYNVPLIADIHFTPNAAELAARIVEKVRVNPGNYADKKKFQQIEYSDSEYNSELERIRERFIPLVRICKEYGTAMRIGTNHGSLSDRIMSRYGDSPLGMVESALEFVRICESMNYYNIVLSMKASNPQIMVQAYRLLVQKMQIENMYYPLHLGVTEAGDGEDARIKSAAGIGTLLEDGLGDTVRVSLTEDPEHEAPVAISLINRYNDRTGHKAIPEMFSSEKNGLEKNNLGKISYSLPYDPYSYHKRTTLAVAGIGGNNLPKVFSDFSNCGIKHQKDLQSIGYTYDQLTDKWNISDQASDFIFAGNEDILIELPNNLYAVFNYAKWNSLKDLSLKNKSFPLYNNISEFYSSENRSDKANFVLLTIDRLPELDLIQKDDRTIIFVLETTNLHAMAELRRIFIELDFKGFLNPVTLKRTFSNALSDQNLLLYSSTDFGALLLDGFGDAVWIGCEKNAHINKELVNRILFGILQAARLRISKTEYIACPSCGRTLFDLQEVTARIRQRTGHLKGVKIGIMGCIVNGPGEMADADYGYVGSGVGKITLYRGKTVVRRSINSDEAVDALIGLIKEDNNWIEPAG